MILMNEKRSVTYSSTAPGTLTETVLELIECEIQREVKWKAESSKPLIALTNFANDPTSSRK